MKRNLIICLATIGLSGIGAKCFAPIYDKNIKAPDKHEASQSELENQQKYQKVIGEVGYVPMVTNRDTGHDVEVDPRAKDPLKAAGNRLSPSDARENLVRAQESLQSDQHHGSAAPWIGLFCLVIGGATVFGVRSWANKNIPKYEEVRKVNW